MSFWTTPLSTTISNWFGGSSSSSSNKSTSSTATKTTSSSTSTGASNTGSSAQSKNKNSSTGTRSTTSTAKTTGTGSTSGNWRNSPAGVAISLGEATLEDYAAANERGANYVVDNLGNVVYEKKDGTLDYPSVPTTGSNIGSTGGSTTASNIEAAKPVQSNISGGGTTYTLTYSSDMGGKGTSQTWQSSDGSGAIAFAGISASDLALYYAQQGNYEASAKLNSLAAAEAAGMTSFTVPATATNNSSGNWRNSPAGVAISLGEATLEDYAAANERGANYVVDNLGNVVYEKKDGTLDYPSVPTTGSTLTAGMQATQSTYAVTTPEAIISASQPSIPTDPGTANLPTDTGGTNLPTTQEDIVVNIEIPETSATGGGDSGIMEMLAALFMMNQANSGGDIGWQAGPAPEPETKEETEETQDWKKYILPIGGALLFVGVVALVVSNNNGGAKA